MHEYSAGGRVLDDQGFVAMLFVCGDDDGSVWKRIEVGEVVFGWVSGSAWIRRVVEVTYRRSGREDL